MKANRIEHNRRHGIAILIGLVLLVGLAVGLKIGYDKLKAVYFEQCVIRDMSAQVEITSGKMVHPSTIAEEFGLRVGKNLAEIDFSKKREEVLAKVPNLLSIRITRRLPDKVIIAAEERTPIAKMGVRGQKRLTGRVVDAHGVVFVCQRGTQMLPTILEPQAPGTRAGQSLAGRALAALRLVEASRAPELLELGILDVDTSRHDFLLATLGNYSKLKILWEGMDDPSVSSQQDLQSRLLRLRDAIRSRVSPDAVIWNATIPGEIFADTQKKI